MKPRKFTSPTMNVSFTVKDGDEYWMEMQKPGQKALLATISREDGDETMRLLVADGAVEVEEVEQ